MTMHFSKLSSILIYYSCTMYVLGVANVRLSSCSYTKVYLGNYDIVL